MEQVKNTTNEKEAFPKQDLENQSSEPSDHQVPKSSAFKSLGILDQFLALWIFLAMAVGIILGNFVPNIGPALQKGKFVGVSIPIGQPQFTLISLFNRLTKALAVGLLVMMYPILCKIKYECLHDVFRKRQIWTQIGLSIFLNWIIAPLLMVSYALRSHDYRPSDRF